MLNLRQLYKIIAFIYCVVNCTSCYNYKKIRSSAKAILFSDSALSTGHIGISIYEPATNKYWYNNNETKYFTPASNIKLFTLYAVLKYLPDSLPGIKYRTYAIANDTFTEILPTADPSFLNSDFNQQPVYEFLKLQKKIVINKTQPLNLYGNGWAWNDYAEPYMRPLSSFPIHGNILKFTWVNKDSITIQPPSFKKNCDIVYPLDSGFNINNKIGADKFYIYTGADKMKRIPFEPTVEEVVNILKDTLNNSYIAYHNDASKVNDIRYKTIYSQLTDTVCKIMMHRSDNFLAEQLLLMASNEFTHQMNTSVFTDSIIKKDFADIQQQPIWADGSGLSRYNLFTPQNFVYILNKLQNDFGIERVKKILSTGGQGTLKEYYKTDSGFIYAKTGTLSNQVALSGYLITKKSKQLIFSVLINNMAANAVNFRKATEQFLTKLRNEY